MIYEKELTDLIVGLAITVHKTLGAGFVEKVYENSLCIELSDHCIKFEKQYPLKVYYKENVVGEYVVDILVENKVILELKACSVILPVHEAQLHNYLSATNINIGYILNFGNPNRLEFKRLVI